MHPCFVRCCGVVLTYVANVCPWDLVKGTIAPKQLRPQHIQYRLKAFALVDLLQRSDEADAQFLNSYDVMQN